MTFYFVTKILGFACIICNVLYAGSVCTRENNGSNPGSNHESVEAEWKPNICEDASIDAITRTHAGNTYAFQGDWYWKIVNDSIADGYPKLITRCWKGLQGYIDACLTITTGETYFFKGTQYWKFNETRNSQGQVVVHAYSGYPREISRQFPGIPDQLDAAFQWKKDGQLYFFKGHEYWQWNFDKVPHVDPSYPAPISAWAGLPDGGISAAFVADDDVSYFFKDDKYYRFNDTTSKVATDRDYPAATDTKWFNCSVVEDKDNTSLKTV